MTTTLDLACAVCVSAENANLWKVICHFYSQVCRARRVGPNELGGANYPCVPLKPRLRLQMQKNAIIKRETNNKINNLICNK